MNNVSKSDQGELLQELCRKHGLEPKVVEELIKIEKQCQHMERRLGISDALKRCILDSLKTPERVSDER